ncbi:MAG: hypothetical protein V9E96_05900 [Chitinophagaceae bacterium]
MDLRHRGKAIYETEYNSGLGSNGLTSARHDVLSKHYAEKYPETFENSLSDDVVYIGKNKLEDELTVDKWQILPLVNLLLKLQHVHMLL